MLFDFITRQTPPVVEEKFQTEIIEGMSRHLLNSSLPALLRAPTGSGKTLIMGRVLEKLCQHDDFLWLWFVPFVNLVQQTEEAITANCHSLKPYIMATERQYDHHNRDVLIANAGQVASKSQQRKIFNPPDEWTPAIHALIDRARANGLKIGVVIDEAHIGVSSETEFGKFCKQIAPDKLILATATPKDQKLNQFLGYGEFTAFESFIVSRDQAVEARLNKRYVVAYVYRVGDIWKDLADIRKSILKQAWQRHLNLKFLVEQNIATVPLLLVQVENGKDTTSEAFRYLTEQCHVPPGVIGEHSADNPDPVLMASIANNPHKEILIFKESAGTGFDAPRAFTLASMKTVIDSDFATQFVGRIMRVDRQVRSAMLKQDLPDDLQTAFLYLANAESQEGFQRALEHQKIQADLKGSSERLDAHATRNGNIVITNRPVNQLPILPNLPLPLMDESNHPYYEADNNAQPQAHFYSQKQESLFPEDAFGVENKGVFPKAKLKLELALADKAAIEAAYREINIALYPLKQHLPCFNPSLKSEKRPSLDCLNGIARAVAEKLSYSSDQFRIALSAARDKIFATEISTELTARNKLDEKGINLALNRDQLAKEAKRILKTLPQLEEADHKILAGILEKRLQSDVKQWLELSNDAITEQDIRQSCRDTAHVLIILLQQELTERTNQVIADQVITVTAKPLPDTMIFPAEISLCQSSKNIYGYYPPSKETMAQVEQTLLIDERRFLSDKVYQLPEGSAYSIGYFDYTYALNNEEFIFAKALDAADFVLWWHRNPDRKPYSTAIVRADKANYFYPDFVLCVNYYEDADPKIRLVETKEDTKDAMNKARRTSTSYGKVLFLTRNNQKLHIVNDDGSLGKAVSDNLIELRERLRETGSSVFEKSVKRL